MFEGIMELRVRTRRAIRLEELCGGRRWMHYWAAWRWVPYAMA